MRLPGPCVLAVAGVLVACLPAQRVWVVSSAPAAGADFTSIQAGVDAAADGDVLLVRAGTYDGFRIVGKSLDVVADGGVVSVQNAGSVEVVQLAVSQSVVIRGVSVSGTAVAPLSIRSCAGPVMVEDGLFTSTFGFGFSAAANLADAPRVTLSRCQLLGSSTLRNATLGLAMNRSRAGLFGCTVTGGSGGSAFAAAPAAWLIQSDLFAVDCGFRGGNGPAGQSFSGICLRPPGDGAPAIDLEDAASSASLQSCTLRPGLAGAPAPPCAPASPGAPVDGPGTSWQANGPLSGLDVVSPARGGSNLQITLSGPSGLDAWLLADVQQWPTFSRACGGPILLPLPSTLVMRIGTLPATGVLPLSVQVPALPALRGAPVFFQSALASPVLGCFVGPPSVVMVLAPGL